MTEETLPWLYDENPEDYEYYITADVIGNNPRHQNHLICNYEKAIYVYADLYNNRMIHYLNIYKIGRKAIEEWLGYMDYAKCHECNDNYKGDINECYHCHKEMCLDCLRYDGNNGAMYCMFCSREDD